MTGFASGGWGSPRRYHRRIWVIPLFWIATAFLTALLTPRLDDLFDLHFASISAASEMAFLSSIASGMMGLTAIVFSLTFVFLQFGSSAYSPRIVSFFTADRIVLHALGVFSGTFLYALISLSAVDQFQSGDVPLITASLALGWLIASIFMFLALIQRVTSLQITNVLALIGSRGARAVEDLYPLLESADAEKLRATSAHVTAYRRDKLPAPDQTVSYKGIPQVVVGIDTAALVTLAQRYNALFVMDYAVGDVVSDASQVLGVHEAHKSIAPDLLKYHIALGVEPVIEQDPKYALRLLVDIAIKALSPAINDPTTAVQSLNQIEDLLRRVGVRQLDVGYARDRQGALRLIYPTPQWQDFLSLGIDEIRYYGANSLQVMRRLRAMLDELERVVPTERRPEVQAHARRVHDSVQRTFPDASDRFDAEQLDRQGLGQARPQPEPESPEEAFADQEPGSE